jgi:hypothetical protein
MQFLAAPLPAPLLRWGRAEQPVAEPMGVLETDWFHIGTVPTLTDWEAYPTTNTVETEERWQWSMPIKVVKPDQDKPGWITLMMSDIHAAVKD